MSETRESMFKGLWPAKRKPLDEMAEQQLDAALERLSHSLAEHSGVCREVRRRQSSGSLRIVSIPAPSLDAE